MTYTKSDFSDGIFSDGSWQNVCKKLSLATVCGFGAWATSKLRLHVLVTDNISFASYLKNFRIETQNSLSPSVQLDILSEVIPYLEFENEILETIESIITKLETNNSAIGYSELISMNDQIVGIRKNILNLNILGYGYFFILLHLMILICGELISRSPKDDTFKPVDYKNRLLQYVSFSIVEFESKNRQVVNKHQQFNKTRVTIEINSNGLSNVLVDGRSPDLIKDLHPQLVTNSMSLSPEAALLSREEIISALQQIDQRRYFQPASIIVSRYKRFLKKLELNIHRN